MDIKQQTETVADLLVTKSLDLRIMSLIYELGMLQGSKEAEQTNKAS